MVRLRRDMVSQSLDHAALADTGLADQHDELAVALLRAAPPLAEVGDLALPSDERRERLLLALEAALHGLGPERAVGLERARRAVRRGRAEGLELELVMHERLRALADQNGVVARPALEPGRDMGGVALDDRRGAGAGIGEPG